jgi:hypothetical protein
LKGELLLDFGKILCQLIAPKDLDNYFDKAETQFLKYTLVP